MKRAIREKRNELFIKSKRLQELAIDEGKKFDIRDKQIKAYKKWEFYDKLIKASEKNN